MNEQAYDSSFGGSPAENYERHFVPWIGAPLADDLIRTADIRSGQRVLDAACGTGVVTRLAAERAGPAGAVAGLDVNPAMLEVARSNTPAGAPIEWHEASVEDMPLADAAFDLVLCQMGLQFVPDKSAAMREMHRVLGQGGRAIVSVPGPRPPLFAVLARALSEHFGPQSARFVDLVFSLHDAGEIRALTLGAGFRAVDTRRTVRTLDLPAPETFLWQYIGSTPIAEAAAAAGAAQREALERAVCAGWQGFTANGSLRLEVGMTTAIAVK